MKLKLVLLAAASVLVATPASANVLNLTGLNENIGGGNERYEEEVLRATFDCAVSCLGSLSSAADETEHAGNVPFPDVTTVSAPSSATTAELFELVNSGAQTEIDAVNLITGSSFTSFTKIDNDETITTDAQYILIKIGADPNYALIENTGGAQDFDFSQFGQGAGLSHVSLFGGTFVVSEPGILALFGVGLMLLGFMRRRAIA